MDFNWMKYLDLIITISIILWGMYWGLKFLQALKTDRPIETASPLYPGIVKVNAKLTEKKRLKENKDINKFS